MALWTRRVQDSGPPADSGREWTRVLIPPDVLGRWVNRPHGQVTFRLTQLLTGHGCFNRYLNRTGRAPSPGCSHCGPPGSNGDEEDSAYHTLVRCKAFDGEREALVQRIGDFAPSDLVSRMLESPAAWDAVVRFAEAVMSAKEEAERAWQRKRGIAPSRRGRAGRAA